MRNLRFDKKITALLVIEPYNDFISEGGKAWDRLKTVAEAKLVAAEFCLRERGGIGPYCAKLHHANDKQLYFQPRHAAGSTIKKPKTTAPAATRKLAFRP